MTPTQTPNAAPGWYADPWGLAKKRWWNGTAWTANTTGNGTNAPRSRVEPVLAGLAIAALALLALVIGSSAAGMDVKQHCKGSRWSDCAQDAAPNKTQLFVVAGIDLMIVVGLAFVARRAPGTAGIVAVTVTVVTLIAAAVLALSWSLAANAPPM